VHAATAAPAHPFMMLCAAAALTACALAPSIGVLSVATTALGLTAVRRTRGASGGEGAVPGIG
jgi:hypothetical protein